MRKKRNIPPKHVTYIFVEGETEAAYFNELKQKYNAGSTQIIKKLNGSGDYVDQAEKQVTASNNVPDNKVLIFDTNGKTSPQIKKLLTKAQSKGYDFGYSNTCFELWLLAHFEQVSQSLIKEKSLIIKLNNYVTTGKYKKADPNQIARIVETAEGAINNSKSISSINISTLNLGFQFTTVGEIVEKHFTNK